MATHYSTAILGLAVDTKQFEKQIGSVGRETLGVFEAMRAGADSFELKWNDLTAGIKDTKRIISGILVSSAFYGLTNALTEAGAAALEFSSNMETAEISMEYFVSGTDKAAQSLAYLREINDFAARTPFSTEDALALSKYVQAMGLGINVTQSFLEVITDTAAATGATTENLQRITLALGQMLTKGRLANEEIRQLANANIPIYEILQEELGLTGTQISNIGKYWVDANLAVEGILTGLEKRYGGAADRIAETVTGMLDTIVDDAKIIAQEAGSSLYDGFENGLRKLRDKLDAWRTIATEQGGVALFNDITLELDPSGELLQWITMTMGNLKQLGSALKELYITAQPLLKVVGQGFVTALNTAVVAITSMVNIVDDVTAKLEEMGMSVSGLAETLAALYIGYQAAKWLTTVGEAATYGAVQIGNMVQSLFSVLPASMAAYSGLASVAAGIAMVAGTAMLAYSVISNLTNFAGTGDSMTDSMSRWNEAMSQYNAEMEAYNEAIAQYQERFQDPYTDIYDGAIEGAGAAIDAAKEVEKQNKKSASASAQSWVAAFDEVYSIPDMSAGSAGAGDTDVPKFPDFGSLLDDLAFKFPSFETEPVKPEFNWDNVFGDSLFDANDDLLSKLKGMWPALLAPLLSGIAGTLLKHRTPKVTDPNADADVANRILKDFDSAVEDIVRRADDLVDDIKRIAMTTEQLPALGEEGWKYLEQQTETANARLESLEKDIKKLNSTIIEEGGRRIEAGELLLESRHSIAKADQLLLTRKIERLEKQLASLTATTRYDVARNLSIELANTRKALVASIDAQGDLLTAGGDTLEGLAKQLRILGDNITSIAENTKFSRTPIGDGTHKVVDTEPYKRLLDSITEFRETYARLTSTGADVATGLIDEHTKAVLAVLDAGEKRTKNLEDGLKKYTALLEQRNNAAYNAAVIDKQSLAEFGSLFGEKQNQLFLQTMSYVDNSVKRLQVLSNEYVTKQAAIAQHTADMAEQQRLLLIEQRAARVEGANEARKRAIQAERDAAEARRGTNGRYLRDSMLANDVTDVTRTMAISADNAFMQRIADLEADVKEQFAEVKRINRTLKSVEKDLAWATDKAIPQAIAANTAKLKETSDWLTDSQKALHSTLQELLDNGITTEEIVSLFEGHTRLQKQMLGILQEMQPERSLGPAAARLSEANRFADALTQALGAALAPYKGSLLYPSVRAAAEAKFAIPELKIKGLSDLDSLTGIFASAGRLETLINGLGSYGDTIGSLLTAGNSNLVSLLDNQSEILRVAMAQGSMLEPLVKLVAASQYGSADGPIQLRNGGYAISADGKLIAQIDTVIQNQAKQLLFANDIKVVNSTLADSLMAASEEFVPGLEDLAGIRYISAENNKLLTTAIRTQLAAQSALIQTVNGRYLAAITTFSREASYGDVQYLVDGFTHNLQQVLNNSNLSGYDLDHIFSTKNAKLFAEQIMHDTSVTLEEAVRMFDYLVAVPTFNNRLLNADGTANTNPADLNFSFNRLADNIHTYMVEFTKEQVDAAYNVNAAKLYTDLRVITSSLDPNVFAQIPTAFVRVQKAAGKTVYALESVADAGLDAYAGITEKSYLILKGLQAATEYNHWIETNQRITWGQAKLVANAVGKALDLLEVDADDAVRVMDQLNAAVEAIDGYRRYILDAGTDMQGMPGSALPKLELPVQLLGADESVPLIIREMLKLEGIDDGVRSNLTKLLSQAVSTDNAVLHYLSAQPRQFVLPDVVFDTETTELIRHAADGTASKPMLYQLSMLNTRTGAIFNELVNYGHTVNQAIVDAVRSNMGGAATFITVEQLDAAKTLEELKPEIASFLQWAARDGQPAVLSAMNGVNVYQPGGGFDYAIMSDVFSDMSVQLGTDLRTAWAALTKSLVGKEFGGSNAAIYQAIFGTTAEGLHDASNDMMLTVKSLQAIADGTAEKSILDALGTIAALKTGKPVGQLTEAERLLSAGDLTMPKLQQIAAQRIPTTGPVADYNELLSRVTSLYEDEATRALAETKFFELNNAYLDALRTGTSNVQDLPSYVESYIMQYRNQQVAAGSLGWLDDKALRSSYSEMLVLTRKASGFIDFTATYADNVGETASLFNGVAESAAKAGVSVEEAWADIWKVLGKQAPELTDAFNKAYQAGVASFNREFAQTASAAATGVDFSSTVDATAYLMRSGLANTDELYSAFARVATLADQAGVSMDDTWKMLSEAAHYTDDVTRSNFEAIFKATTNITDTVGGASNTFAEAAEEVLNAGQTSRNAWDKFSDWFKRHVTNKGATTGFTLGEQVFDSSNLTRLWNEVQAAGDDLLKAKGGLGYMGTDGAKAVKEAQKVYSKTAGAFYEELIGQTAKSLKGYNNLKVPDMRFFGDLTDYVKNLDPTSNYLAYTLDASGTLSPLTHNLSSSLDELVNVMSGLSAGSMYKAVKASTDVFKSADEFINSMQAAAQIIAAGDAGALAKATVQVREAYNILNEVKAVSQGVDLGSVSKTTQALFETFDDLGRRIVILNQSTGEVVFAGSKAADAVLTAAEGMSTTIGTVARKLVDGVAGFGLIDVAVAGIAAAVQHFSDLQLSSSMGDLIRVTDTTGVIPELDKVGYDLGKVIGDEVYQGMSEEFGNSIVSGVTSSLAFTGVTALAHAAGAKIGGTIGTALGGPVGTLVGVAAGAIVGVITDQVITSLGGHTNTNLYGDDFTKLMSKGSLIDRSEVETALGRELTDSEYQQMEYATEAAYAHSVYGNAEYNYLNRDNLNNLIYGNDTHENLLNSDDLKWDSGMKLSLAKALGVDLGLESIGLGRSTNKNNSGPMERSTTPEYSHVGTYVAPTDFGKYYLGGGKELLEDVFGTTLELRVLNDYGEAANPYGYRGLYDTTNERWIETKDIEPDENAAALLAYVRSIYAYGDMSEAAMQIADAIKGSDTLRSYLAADFDKTGMNGAARVVARDMLGDYIPLFNATYGTDYSDLDLLDNALFSQQLTNFTSAIIDAGMARYTDMFNVAADNYQAGKTTQTIFGSTGAFEGLTPELIAGLKEIGLDAKVNTHEYSGVESELIGMTGLSYDDLSITQLTDTLTDTLRGVRIDASNIDGFDLSSMHLTTEDIEILAKAGIQINSDGTIDFMKTTTQSGGERTFTGDVSNVFSDYVLEELGKKSFVMNFDAGNFTFDPAEVAKDMYGATFALPSNWESSLEPKVKEALNSIGTIMDSGYLMITDKSILNGSQSIEEYVNAYVGGAKKVGPKAQEALRGIDGLIQSEGQAAVDNIIEWADSIVIPSPFPDDYLTGDVKAALSQAGIDFVTYGDQLYMQIQNTGTHLKEGCVMMAKNAWENLPDSLKTTFEKLGITATEQGNQVMLDLSKVMDAGAENVVSVFIDEPELWQQIPDTVKQYLANTVLETDNGMLEIKRVGDGILVDINGSWVTSWEKISDDVLGVLGTTNDGTEISLGDLKDKVDNGLFQVKGVVTAADIPKLADDEIAVPFDELPQEVKDSLTGEGGLDGELDGALIVVKNTAKEGFAQIVSEAETGRDNFTDASDGISTAAEEMARRIGEAFFDAQNKIQQMQQMQAAFGKSGGLFGSSLFATDNHQGGTYTIQSSNKGGDYSTTGTITVVEEMDKNNNVVKWWWYSEKDHMWKPTTVSPTQWAGYTGGYKAAGGVVDTDVTMVGERGRELAILPNGSIRQLGLGGPELTDLPKGTHVLNNQDTNKILRYQPNISHLKTYADGNTRLQIQNASANTLKAPKLNEQDWKNFKTNVVLDTLSETYAAGEKLWNELRDDAQFGAPVLNEAAWRTFQVNDVYGTVDETFIAGANVWDADRQSNQFAAPILSTSSWTAYTNTVRSNVDDTAKGGYQAWVAFNEANQYASPILDDASWATFAADTQHRLETTASDAHTVYETYRTSNPLKSFDFDQGTWQALQQTALTEMDKVVSTMQNALNNAKFTAKIDVYGNVSLNSGVGGGWDNTVYDMGSGIPGRFLTGPGYPTSPFGERTLKSGKTGFHHGADYAAAPGTGIKAGISGTVIWRQNSVYGNYADVVAADGTYVRMAHMQGYNGAFPSGSQVEPGNIIGYVGSTGNSEGPHLHLEYHPRGGAAVNPIGYFAAGGTTTDPFSLVGEAGRELAILPNGEVQLIDKPMLTDLPKGTRILNNKDTNKVLSYMPKISQLNAYADGNTDLELTDEGTATEDTAQSVDTLTTALHGFASQLFEFLESWRSTNAGVASSVSSSMSSYSDKIVSALDSIRSSSSSFSLPGNITSDLAQIASNTTSLNSQLSQLVATLSKLNGVSDTVSAVKDSVKNTEMSYKDIIALARTMYTSTDDPAIKELAHTIAELARATQGYSGGPDGSQKILLDDATTTVKELQTQVADMLLAQLESGGIEGIISDDLKAKMTTDQQEAADLLIVLADMLRGWSAQDQGDVTQILGGIADAASTISGVLGSFASWTGEQINSLSSTVAALQWSASVSERASASSSSKTIKGSASGSLVTEDALYRAGELGLNEAIIPLEQPAVLALVGEAIADAMPDQQASIVIQGNAAVSTSNVDTITTAIRGAVAAICENQDNHFIEVIDKISQIISTVDNDLKALESLETLADANDTLRETINELSSVATNIAESLSTIATDIDYIVTTAKELATNSTVLSLSEEVDALPDDIAANLAISLASWYVDTINAAREEYTNATSDAERAAAHAKAETARSLFGFSGGADGSEHIATGTGVFGDSDAGYKLLQQIIEQIQLGDTAAYEQSDKQQSSEVDFRNKLFNSLDTGTKQLLVELGNNAAKSLATSTSNSQNIIAAITQGCTQVASAVGSYVNWSQNKIASLESTIASMQAAASAAERASAGSGSVKGSASGSLVTKDALYRAGELGLNEAIIPLERPDVMSLVGETIADSMPGGETNYIIQSSSTSTTEAILQQTDTLTTAIHGLAAAILDGQDDYGEMLATKVDAISNDIGDKLGKLESLDSLTNAVDDFAVDVNSVTSTAETLSNAVSSLNANIEGSLSAVSTYIEEILMNGATDATLAMLPEEIGTVISAELLAKATEQIAQAGIDWRNATTDEERAAAHAKAEEARGWLGYSGGADGSQYIPLDQNSAEEATVALKNINDLQTTATNAMVVWVDQKALLEQLSNEQIGELSKEHQIMVQLGTTNWNNLMSYLATMTNSLGSTIVSSANMVASAVGSYVRYAESTMASQRAQISSLQSALSSAMSAGKSSKGSARGSLITEDALYRAGELGLNEAIIPLEQPDVMQQVGRTIASYMPAQNVMQLRAVAGMSNAGVAMPAVYQPAPVDSGELVSTVTQHVLEAVLPQMQQNDDDGENRRPLYVGTLIADDRGLRTLERKLYDIRQAEATRR